MWIHYGLTLHCFWQAHAKASFLDFFFDFRSRRENKSLFSPSHRPLFPTNQFSFITLRARYTTDHLSIDSDRLTATVAFDWSFRIVQSIARTLRKWRKKKGIKVVPFGRQANWILIWNEEKEKLRTLKLGRLKLEPWLGQIKFEITSTQCTMSLNKLKTQLKK